MHGLLNRITQLIMVSAGKSGEQKNSAEFPALRVENQEQCSPDFRGYMPREAHPEHCEGENLNLRFSG